MLPRRACLSVSIMVALALLVAACGTATSDVSRSSGGSDGAVADVRTVQHDQGETEVPADPQRVVTLDSSHLDAALSLGVTPVGAVSVFADQGTPAYLGDQADGIEVVGTIEEPDLEAIAALEPDLILSATVRHEQLYDQLTSIAPTVFTESAGTDWQQGVAVVAEALDRADEAEQVLAEYDQRTDELGERLGAEQLQAAIVRFLPGETRIYGPETFSGSLLTDLGFDLPDLDYDEYSMAVISTEQVDLLGNADVVFATTYGAEEESTRGEVTELWAGLPAVEGDCQFDVDDDEWMIGIGPLGAEVILEDLEQQLADHACGRDDA